MRVKNLYCFRHGQTDWNKEKRYQGWTDIPLNEVGRSQAKRWLPFIPQFSLECIYASPLKRAWETAQIIAEPNHLKVIPHFGLLEVYMGEVQGLTVDEIMKRFGQDAIDKWKSEQKDHEDFGFPAGENKIPLRKRALHTIISIAKESQGHNIGIFTHGDYLRQLVIASGSQDHTHIKNTEVFHFTYDLDHHQLILVRRLNLDDRSENDNKKAK